MSDVELSDAQAADNWMAVMLAREISPGDVVGVGLASPLAAAAVLAARHLDPSITMVMQSMVNPVGTLSECFLGIDHLRERASAWLDHFTLLGVCEGGGIDVQFMRPAQVDAEGNLNSSRVRGADGTMRFLPGGMAQPDATVLMNRVVAYHPEHSHRTLPRRVDYVTAAGRPARPAGAHRRGVLRVVTSIAVIDLDDAPTLVGTRPDVSVDDVVDATAFELIVTDECGPLIPDPEELLALFHVDAERLRRLDLPDHKGELLAVLARGS